MDTLQTAMERFAFQSVSSQGIYPMRFPAILAVVVACLFGGLSQAQDCSTGQCFKTPVRNVAAKVIAAQPVRSAVKVAARPVVNTVQFFQSVQPVRSSVRALFGVQQVSQSSCSFQVGGYDTDGALITSIGQSTTSSAPVSEVSSLGFRNRKASREAILEAANKAHDACTINSDELRAIRLACMSPRMLSKIEDLVIEKAQTSGAYTFALKANGEVDKAAIDWEAIGDFILKIAPLIFKLIELFAVLENANPAHANIAFSYDQPLNFHSTLSMAC